MDSLLLDSMMEASSGGRTNTPTHLPTCDQQVAAGRMACQHEWATYIGSCLPVYAARIHSQAAHGGSAYPARASNTARLHEKAAGAHLLPAGCFQAAWPGCALLPGGHAGCPGQSARQSSAPATFWSHTAPASSCGVHLQAADGSWIHAACLGTCWRACHLQMRMPVVEGPLRCKPHIQLPARQSKRL